MWYNVRCWNGDEWAIYGVYCFVDSSTDAASVDESCYFDYPESVTYMGYSFWLGAEALEELEVF